MKILSWDFNVKVGKEDIFHDNQAFLIVVKSVMIMGLEFYLHLHENVK
jgi:hypothetical protein